MPSASSAAKAKFFAVAYTPSTAMPTRRAHKDPAAEADQAADGLRLPLPAHGHFRNEEKTTGENYGRTDECVYQQRPNGRINQCAPDHGRSAGGICRKVEDGHAAKAETALAGDK